MKEERNSELDRKIHSIACKIADTVFEAGGLNNIKCKVNLRLLYPGIASIIKAGIREATETVGKEINEDNCVLDKNELYLINLIFESKRKQVGDPGFGLKEISDSFLNKIFDKINKLNDIIKERK